MSMVILLSISSSFYFSELDKEYAANVVQGDRDQ